MIGRKPKPTALKLISGNPGKRPLNTREPKPVQSIPTCPTHLNPSAKTEWKRLVQQLHGLAIISQLDRAVLAGCCQAYGRWVDAERKLKQTAYPAEDAVELRAVLAVAGHCQQAAGTHG